MKGDWTDQGPKSKELADEASALAMREGIPLTLALIKISRENPLLCEAARIEVLGVSSNPVEIGSVGLELVTLSEARKLSRDPSERLAQIAEIRARDKHVPYSVALAEVRRECPELAHAARLRVLGKGAE